jgi:hypothetical protein
MTAKLAIDIGKCFFGDCSSSGGGFQEPTDISTLVTIGVGDAMVGAGVVLIIMIIISGYSMISGSGDPQKQTQARNILTYAIIGFILVTAAFFIVYIIETSTGITILGN